MRRTLGALLACLLLVTGCSSLSGTGDKGFYTGDGGVDIVQAVDRGDPVDLTGTDLDGKPIDLADYRGKPVVVVVWGSWCGPCRGEAPDVVAAPKPKPAEVPIVPWAVTGGLAVGTLVVGIFAAKSYGHYEDKRDSFPVTRSELDDAQSSARTLFIVTTALGAATVVAAGASTYFTLTATKKDSLRVEAGLGRVGLAGSF